MIGRTVVVFLLTLALLSGALVIVPDASASAPGWEEKTALPTDNTAFATCKLDDGRVFMYGGLYWADFRGYSEAYIFDPEDLTWKPCASAPMGLMGCSAEAMPDGKVYVFGGSYPEALQKAMIYDVAADSWSMGMNSTPHGPFLVETVVLNETAIMLVGGLDPDTSTVYSLCYVYNIVTDEFTPAHPLPSPRAGGALIKEGQRLYYIGGHTDTFAPSSNIFMYDMGSGNWQYYADLPSPRVHLRAVNAADGVVYLVGGAGTTGFQNSASNQVSMLSLNDFTVHEAPALPMNTRLCGLVELDSGELFAFGGHEGAASNFYGYVLDIWSKNAWLSDSTVGTGGSVRVYVDVDVYQHGPASVYCTVYLMMGDVVLDSKMFYAEDGFTASVLLSIPEDAEPGIYTIFLERVGTETPLGSGEYDFQEFEINVTSAASLQDQVDDLQEQNQDLKDALEGKMDAWVGYVLLAITAASLLLALLVLIRKK